MFGYLTKELLDADLAHPANTLATVAADADSSNNTTWIKIGASGTGSWQKSAIAAPLPFYDARKYASFASAVAAIGSTPAVLIVSTTQAISSSITTPSTLTVQVVHGGSFDISSGQTLTLTKPPIAGLYRIFSGSGAVEFGPGQHTVPVQWYGAVGDGVTDDTSAIQRALYSAGTGATVIFGSRACFQLSSYITPYTGQTLALYGATLKRINQIVTTTSTPITTGGSPTTITVANPAGFAVGMRITVTSGSQMTQGDPGSHAITAIAGNNITVTTAFSVAFPSGGTVTGNTHLISTSYADVKILGGEIDGNAANNTTYRNWQNNAAISMYSDRGVIRDVYIHDSPSDAIILGGISPIVDNCKIVNSGGNAIHLSGTAHPKIVGNYIKNTNTAITGTDSTTGPGHSEGAITLSNLVSDATLTNNYIENGRTFVGSISSPDNSDITIANNTMRTARLYAIEWSEYAPTTLTQNVVITGNRIYNGIKVYANNTAGVFGFDLTPKNFIFAGNYLYNTRIELRWMKYAEITGNLIDLTGDTTSETVAIPTSSFITVSNNIIIGGLYGITVGVGVTNVTVSNNQFRNQYISAIYGVYSAGYYTKSTSAVGNTVLAESSFSKSASYVAIQASNGMLVANNQIVQSGGVRGIYCIGDLIATPANIPGALVHGNVVRTDPGVPSIRIGGGNSNNIVTGNYVVQPVSNSGGTPENTVENNYTIY
jgi:hypothetical protein